MSSRALLHLLVIVIVAIGIYFFPEFRETRANARFDNEEGGGDVPTDLLSDPSDRLQELLLLSGLRGRAIGVDGAPLRGVPLNASPPSTPDYAPPPSRDPAARSRVDGTFEIPGAETGAPVVVHGDEFAILSARRLVQLDESDELLLVIAPTSPVAGRILGARGDEIVSFQATHPLPEEAREPGSPPAIVFQRSVPLQADGSFNFGRLPCSDACFIETSSSQGKSHRLPLFRAGSSEAQIDLR